MRTLSKVLALTVSLVLAKAGVGQVTGHHTMWTYTVLQDNPAAAGNLFSLDAALSYRKQWLDLEGSPSTTRASLGAPVYRINSGAYFGIERDELGVRRNTTLRGAFAYRLIRSEHLDVSVGLGASFRQADLNGSALRTDDGIYEGGTVEHLDDLLARGPVNGSTFGVDVGVEARYKSYTLGVSVRDVNAPVADFELGATTWPRVASAYARALLPVWELVELDAGALVYTDFAVTQAQASVTAWYGGNIGVGGAFRGAGATTLDAVSLLLGWRPSASLTVAYSYDYGLSDLSGVHENTHEVALRYVMSTPIGKGKLPPIIFNPRL